MKRFVITEDEKNHIQKMYGLINEQQMEPQDTKELGNDELNSRMESYKNKMDNFLDKLKSSGDKIDGTRFLKQVRNQTDQIYWELDEKSEKPLTSFAQLQLDLLKHFRHKLKEQ